MCADRLPSRASLADETRTKRLRRFVGNPKFSDVSLIVGPQREVIPASRVLLASASDALESMLVSTMVEGQPGAAIHIPDLEPTAMRLAH